MTYRHTMYASFIGYIVQAIVNNFVPLLFLTFQSSYHIPLSQITLLVTFNFGLQLCVDALSISFIDTIGYRASMILANGMAAAGLILLTILPEVLPPFAGILLSVMVYAVGGGLLEVVVSPIVESCPTENKEMAMSLLHSFYCWGHMAVVLLSTGVFLCLGIRHWKIMAVLWALVPIADGILFTKVPMYTLQEDHKSPFHIRDLASGGVFWIFILLMLCAGASEQAVSQWASTFAEKSLHMAKWAGDLAGPTLFALFMGASRAFYGKWGDRLDLKKAMLISGGLCMASYMLIAWVPLAGAGFCGMALCGFSVGIMWPGTMSLATATLKGGSTTMFALFALAGDLGCGLGPSVAGFVSSSAGDNLRLGILAALIFPVLLVAGVWGICKGVFAG